MKKIFFSIVSLCLLLIESNAQNTFPATGPVGIGTTSPVASSLLDMRSTTRGLLIPRMTLAQRNLIGAPAVSLLIYQTDGTAGYYYYTGSGWIRLVTSAAATNLSNLAATTAINRTLTPVSNGTFDLGTAALRWRNAYLTGSLTVNSTTGIGVSSYGSTYGLYGYGPYIGVYGNGTSYGVYGSSSTGYGVTGTSSSSNGVYGSSSSGSGVNGVSSSSYGVYGQSGYLGVYGTGTTYGVYGYSGSNYGVYGSSGYIGVLGSGTSYGLYGSGGTYGAYATGSSYGVYGYSYSGSGGYFRSITSNALWAYADNSAASGIYAGVFQSKVYSYGGYFQSSDKNLKKNIQDLGDAMDIIKKLKPKNYEFKTDEKLAALNLPKGTHYGFIAQELEQVLPYIVNDGPQVLNNEPETIKVKSLDGRTPDKSTDPEIVKPGATNKEAMSFKGVNYIELIPIMIRGMQELNEKNEALQAQVDELKSVIAKGGNSITFSSLSGYIKQNVPNPASNNTIISYYLPDNITGKSQIMVTDIKGSVLKVYTASKGAGQVTIKTGELPAGTYNYTLYVNEKRIDSKQMVIAK